MLLYQTLLFAIYGKYKKSYKNHRLSAPTWNEVFELPDGSCSVSDI